MYPLSTTRPAVRALTALPGSRPLTTDFRVMALTSRGCPV
jgi:hypothetical protein